MSVLIKGMEMPPESCESCPFEDFGGCMFRVQKENCPLEEVPTPHGRLIDADALVGEINNRIEVAIKSGVNAIADRNDEIREKEEQAVATLCEASLIAKRMPTIIEAEKG